MLEELHSTAVLKGIATNKGITTSCEKLLVAMPLLLVVMHLLLSIAILPQLRLEPPLACSLASRPYMLPTYGARVLGRICQASEQTTRSKDATRNKCIATSNKGITTRSDRTLRMGHVDTRNRSEDILYFLSFNALRLFYSYQDWSLLKGFKSNSLTSEV